MALKLMTTGDIYTYTIVEFTADISPDGANKPYTYATEYDDGHGSTATSSADPLTSPLNHIFDATGIYDVESRPGTATCPRHGPSPTPCG